MKKYIKRILPSYINPASIVGYILFYIILALLFSSCNTKTFNSINLKLSNPNTKSTDFKVINDNPVLNSIWLNEAGTQGWAVGEGGAIIKYDEKDGWRQAYKAGEITRSPLFALWLNKAGTQGWAAGEGGAIFKYDVKDGWKQAYKAGDIISTYITAFWLNETGTQGWAVGEGGAIIKYNIKEGWKQAYKAGEITISPLFALCLNESGTQGWAVGYGAVRLNYNVKDGWKQAYEANDIISSYVTAFWLNEAGTQGWAVGYGGAIIKYNVKDGWKQAYKAGEITSSSLSALWVNEAGTQGWAVGHDGAIIKYDEKDGWKQAYKAGDITGSDIKALWLNKVGTQGWAVGAGGVIIKYDEKDGWKQAYKASDIPRSSLNALWANAAGTQGWALGHDGAIIKYDEKDGWKQAYKAGEITNSSLTALWVNVAGTQGWAVGYGGVIIKYDVKAGWKQAYNTGDITRSNLTALWIDTAGTAGWAVGSNGAIIKYDAKDGWKQAYTLGDITTSSLTALWLNGAGTAGWAVGSGGAIIKYDAKDGWTLAYKAGYITGSFLNALWLNEAGTQGWAVGYGGEIFNYNVKNGWTRANRAGDITGSFLTALWVNAAGTLGWVVGDGGTIINYDVKDGWKQAYNTADITSSFLTALWVNAAGTKGWAVGYNGCIIEITTKYIGSKSELKYPSSSLFHSCLFICSDSLVVLPTLKLIDFGRIILDSGYYIASWADSTHRKVNFVFNNLPSDFEKDHAGRKYDLIVSANYDSKLPAFAYNYSGNITIGGTPAWVTYLNWIFIYLGVNVLIIIIAIFNSWTRKLLLSPAGIATLPIIPAKYIFTIFFVHNFKFVRLALFTAYRKNYLTAPGFSEWLENSNKYIPPAINEKYAEDEWKNVFLHIISTTNRLFVIIGKSGLGKTALLEKWTILSLNLNLTPILVRLGKHDSINEAVSFQMKNYGELFFNNDEALTIIEDGGFILLLDGFNESTKQEDVRNFILRAAKRNHIILSSQYSPSLDKLINEEEITLEPFGLKQLGFLLESKYNLDKKWAADIIKQPLLQDMASLPQTADLIAEYISKNEKLPEFRLDIYRQLRKGLDEDLQILNLEEKAWLLFKNNTQEIRPDENVPFRFCEQAVDGGILTRDKDIFRFKHERLNRYFVACFLQRQDNKSLEEWNKDIKPGLGRLYWSDCIELWNEIILDNAINNTGLLKVYEAFVLDIISFSRNIYIARISPVIKLIEEAGKLKLSTSFWEEVGRKLSEVS